MSYNHRELVYFELKKFLSNVPIKRVLEIGAGGTGNGDADNAKAVFDEFGIKYVGIDKFSEDKKIKKMDAHNLRAFKEESFDMVYLCHTFEHFTNPIKALKEIKRVLKKGGWLWMATPNNCEHQILGADEDHIFVLGTMQMRRLLRYMGFAGFSYKQYTAGMEVIASEKDINVITFGRKDTK